MKQNSAIRNGEAFTLMKLITKQHCSKGNYFVFITKIYKDAERFLPEFLLFNGNRKVFDSWIMASKTIAPLLQTIPRNIHPDFKPSVCRQRAYATLLDTSNIAYCKCNSNACDVNLIINDYLKVITDPSIIKN